METSEKNKKWFEKTVKTKEEKQKKFDDDFKQKEKFDDDVKRMMVRLAKILYNNRIRSQSKQ